ncbi:glycoside hydrolase family 3 protein [Paenibacillus chungangensis]|uniref:beta-N-acetylhexosaminidase n=1 Tax=Paenibacillus chungangensis TaxID=696535 RepID=A0ABW3HRS6_9BACL
MNLAELDLRTKVGQLFAFSAFHPTLDEETRRMVVELKAGGIFLPTGSLQVPEQVHRLTTLLQSAALAEGSGIPLFISADFVAGAGCKLRSGAVHFPKNRAIGAGEDEQLAYESGRITAKESLAMGVNFNYSPVVDINNNPLNPVIGMHSFGEDRELVSRMGSAIIRGYQEHGMIATAKHFPGHGDTSVDSHEDLPVLPFDLERLEAFELYPFRQAIEAGVDAVMVGHIAVPSLDSTMKPASLSHELVTKLLRQKMKFEGLIVTDGLSMKGVMNQYSMEEACVLSLQAGTDILLATTSCYEDSASVLEAVIKAVESGRLNEARINESVSRIWAMKKKYGLLPDNFTTIPYAPGSFNQPSSVTVAAELAGKAITPVNGLNKRAFKDIDVNKWMIVHDGGVAQFAQEIRNGRAIRQQQAESYEEVLCILKELPTDVCVLIALSHNKRMSTAFTGQLHTQLARFADAIWIHFGSAYDMEGVSCRGLLAYDRAPSLQLAAAQYLLE